MKLNVVLLSIGTVSFIFFLVVNLGGFGVITPLQMAILNSSSIIAIMLCCLIWGVCRSLEWLNTKLQQDIDKYPIRKITMKDQAKNAEKDSDKDPAGEIGVGREPSNQQIEKPQMEEDLKEEIQTQSMNVAKIREKYLSAYCLLTWDVGNGERVVLGYAGKIYKELNDAFTELAEIMAKETGRDIMELWEWPDDLTFSSPEFLPCLERCLEIVQRVPRYVSRSGS
ncbi:MAG: hypothetical protein WC650_03905 [Candidatus Doudnabacteria bacterium]